MKICYSCEYSNEFGYCKFSACKKQSSITDTTNEGLQQQLSQLQQENQKLKSHIEMQDLTIQKLYSQLEQPITTISGTTPVQTKNYTTNYKYKLTSVCTGCERLKQEKKELIKWLEENIEKENNILKMSLTQESKVNSLTIIACFEQILSKLKESDKSETN